MERVLVGRRCPLNFHLRRSCCHRSFVSTRDLPSESSSSQSRGGLPRFHSQILPSSKGGIVRIDGGEFWHMTRVLRLSVNARVELFNGKGGLVEGCIQSIDRNGSDIIALEEPKFLYPQAIQWHVFAAFGTLKGGRSDWLIEKCTELGASSITPLLTERSPIFTDNRLDRLQRVILAAIKQCQRLHDMTLKPPRKLCHFLPVVSILISCILFKISQTKLSFLAAAESTPLLNILSLSSTSDCGIIIVGPEGDFTEDEMKLMMDAGATPVGLGPCRLRVETATIALLSTVMLWSAAQKSNTS